MQPMGEANTSEILTLSRKTSDVSPKKDFTYKLVRNVIISKYLTKKSCTTAALNILSRGTLQCSEKKCYLL